MEFEASFPSDGEAFELVERMKCRRTSERGPGKISVKQTHATVRR
ncbi:hypothetical protein ACFV2N_37695 [Streptomyces sp. NPDC059680]